MRRFRDYHWRGVRAETYRTAVQGGWAKVTRRVLIAGSRGSPVDFDVRYFEIAPGGYTTLEDHRHAHWVMALRGEGRVRLGRRWHRLGRFDACYVPPHVAHQLCNDAQEPFGFLCIVDARRDRGQRLVTSPASSSVRRVRRHARQG